MIYVQVLMSVLICAIIYAVCTEILPDLKQLWSSIKTRFLFDGSKLSFRPRPSMMCKMPRFKRDDYYKELDIEKAYAGLCNVTLPLTSSIKGADLSKIRDYKNEKSAFIKKIRADKQQRMMSYGQNWSKDDCPW